MLEAIIGLFKALSPSQRKRFYALQFLVIITALFETMGVALIGPFMMLVSNKDLAHSHDVFSQLFTASQLASVDDFMFWCGCALLGLLVLGTIVSISTTWLLARFSANVGAEFSNRLFAYYMHQPWLFHIQNSSSSLIKNIATEVARVNEKILAPLLQISARAVLSIFLLVTIFLFNPIVAMTGFCVFALAYFIFYLSVKKYLSYTGTEISKEQAIRFKLMNEGFGGIKDTLLMNRQPSFTSRYDKSNTRYAKMISTTQVFTQAPKYFIELMAFGALIFLTLFLVKSSSDGAQALLVSLSVYGLAGFKLIPAFQNIYGQISTIKGNLAAFELLKEDLQMLKSSIQNNQNSEKDLQFKSAGSIQLSDIRFSYPSKSKPALDGISMKIQLGQSIGFVGSSGSGKSTMADFILGLLEHSEGTIELAGNKPITIFNNRSWKSQIGYVPQSIFLTDTSIAENIAFGLPVDEIDMTKVSRAISMACLTEFINDLPNGLETTVGERGVQLSGGQRQRIGIARALYNDASLLVFDEATSALDGITEKQIMNEIHSLAEDKTTIIIAHRLATVVECDCIYLFDKGKIIAQGSYDELISSNPLFQKMAKYA